MHQPLPKGARRRGGALRARQHLGVIVGLVDLTQRIAQGGRILGRRIAFALALTPLFPRRHCSRENLIRGCQRVGAGERHGALRLRPQPTARIGGRRLQIARTGAQAEAHDGNFGLQHSLGNGSASARLTVKHGNGGALPRYVAQRAVGCGIEPMFNQAERNRLARRQRAQPIGNVRARKPTRILEFVIPQMHLVGQGMRGESQHQRTRKGHGCEE